MTETRLADILAAETDAGAALAAVMDWASTEPWPASILPPDVSTGSYRDYATSLCAALHRKGLPAWADRFAGYAGDPDNQGSFWRDPHISALLDEAGVRLAMDASLGRLFLVVDELWDIAPTRGQDPVYTLIDRLSGFSTDHPLCSKLAQHLGEIVTMPGMRQIVARRPDFKTRNLWPGSHEVPIAHRWPFQVVAKLWPARFMAMMTDDLPPPIVHASIAAASPFELTTLQTLLTAGDLAEPASPARIATDYALLTEIVPLFAERFGTGGQAAVTGALRPLVGSLAARPDWDLLSRAWLQQLIWHGSDRLPRRLAAESSWSGVRDLLIDELCANAPPLRQDPQEWIGDEEDLWRVDRVLAEAGILAAQGDTESAAKLLANGILSGQVTQTARDQALYADKPESRIAGTIIQAQPDPVGWFEQLWIATYEARERATYSHESGYQSPADCVLAWGFAGLNHISDAQVQARYWQAFTKALGERIVTDQADAIPMRLRDNIVRASVFLGTRLQLAGIIQLSEFAQLMSVLIAPSPRFAACVSVLLLADGEALVPRLVLEPSCARFVDALGLSIVAAGRPNTGEEIIPKHMEKLEALHRFLKTARPAAF